MMRSSLISSGKPPARKPRRRFLVVTLALLSMAACRPPPPTPDSFSHLRARFLYEGRPVAGTLIVSDGEFHQQWVDTPEIVARVPSTATWIIDAKSSADTSGLPVTFRDLIPELEIPEGDTLDIVIHLLRPGLPRPFDPVVLIEQADGQAVVSNRVERDPARPGWRRLVSTIAADSGAFLMLDGIYRDPDVSPDSMRAFTCGNGCPHIFANADCSVYCFGCSSTCVYEGYWKGNVNMCSLTATPGAAPTSEFEELAANTGGVHLAATLRRDGLVRPARAELAGPGGQRQQLVPPLRNRSFPDFVVPTGSYRYAVTVPGPQGGEPERYELPVPVNDGRITEMVVRLPAEELDDLQPVVLADTRLLIPDRQISTAAGTGSLEIRVATADPDPGIAWLLVQLPAGSVLRDVIDVATGTPRTDGVDFVIGQRSGRTVVTVRSEGREDSFAIRWE